jgi:hypothetical protein
MTPEELAAAEALAAQQEAKSEEEERLSTTVKSSIREMLEEERRKATELQQQQYRAENPPAYNPTAEALDAVDLRDELLGEAFEGFEDLPAEYKKTVRDKLKHFKDADQLRQAKAAGLHKTFAREAKSLAIDDGKYDPPRFRKVETPKIERTSTVSTTATAGKIPDSYLSEITELEAVLGYKFTPEEVAKGYKDTQQASEYATR